MPREDDPAERPDRQERLGGERRAGVGRSDKQKNTPETLHSIATSELKRDLVGQLISVNTGNRTDSPGTPAPPGWLIPLLPPRNFSPERVLYN